MKDLTEKEKEELLKWKKGVKNLFLILIKFFKKLFLILIKIFLSISIKIKKQFKLFFYISFIVAGVTLAYVKFNNYLTEECRERHKKSREILSC